MRQSEDEVDSDGVVSPSETDWFPIDRVVLIHFGLHEIATGHAVADEAASLEELAVPILYFYENEREQESQDASHQYPSSSIIQIANLASALYTLPKSMSSSSKNEQKRKRLRAKTVDLEKAILVFQPVEEEIMNSNKPGLVLVIQLAKKSPIRQSQNNATREQKETSRKRPVVTTTPQAVATAFATHHRLFCLLRGGGVHTRLQRASVDQQQSHHQLPASATNSSCMYPGMDQFYLLLKQKRKLDDRLKRQEQNRDDSFGGDRAAMQQQARELSELIQSFAKHSLPLDSLRADLNFHYQSFLMEMQHLSVVGSGRCLVEWIPRPPICASSTALCSPTKEWMNQIESLRLSMQQFLLDSGSTSSASILAASCFQQSDHSHLWTVTPVEDTQLANKQDIFLLLSHMTSVHARSGNPSREVSSPQPSSWTRLWPMLTSTSDAVPSKAHYASELLDTVGFISPPPLSSLSVTTEHVQHIEFEELQSEHLHDTEHPLKQSVWAPQIHGLRGLSQSPFSTCRACLYQWKGILRFLFLLTEGRDDEDGDDDSHFANEQSTFDLILAALNQFLHAHARNGFNSNPLSVQRKTWIGEGLQIIFADQDANRVVLYSGTRRDKSSQQGTRDKQSTKGEAIVGNESCGKENHMGSISLNTLGTGVDARHELVSHLGSLDTVLAVEDAMTQFEAEMTNKARYDGQTKLCTLLNRHWLWATHNGHQELYAILDASHYVTIADVESIVNRIQQDFLK